MANRCVYVPLFFSIALPASFTALPAALVASAALYYGEETNTLKKMPEGYLNTLPESWKVQVLKGLENLKIKKGLIEILKSQKNN